MDFSFSGPQGERLGKAVLVAVVLLAVFLGLKSLSELQSMRYIGAGVAPSNTISVSGYGESFATPDIATFSFTVSSKKSTVAAAQEEATAKINAATKYLKDAGIAEKDIQTSDYSVNPQYDYLNQACTNGYCPGGKQVLSGYEVRQTTTVKVRDAAKAGDLLTGVGNKGATEVSSLNFTFDDPNKSQNEARGKAIADAKSKADELAKQLGVHIVRVVSFNESNGGYPMPYAARGTVALQAGDSKAVAPEISIGENKVSSNVSITYEIR
jgi:uncharacterized protein YggE